MGKSKDSKEKGKNGKKGKHDAVATLDAPGLAEHLKRIAPNWEHAPAAAAIDPASFPVREGRPITIDDLYAFVLPGEPNLSPDGTKLAVAVSSVDKEANAYRAALWLVPLDGSPARKLTGGAWSDTSPRWSPDGKTIAFLSNRLEKTNNIWLLPTDGGEARQVTTLKNGTGEIDWAPDSRSLVFTSRVDPESATSANGVETKDDEEKSDVKVITSARYKFDGRGFLEDKVSHVFTLDVTSPDAKPVQLTAGHFNHAAPAWSPTGEQIAFVANRDPDWDRNGIADIWTIPAGGGDPVRITNGAGQLANPAWSPDGSLLAFTGELTIAPIVQNNQLWIATASGNDIHSISSDVDRSIGDPSMSGPGGPVAGATIQWSPDGTAVDALVGDRGQTVVVRFPLTASGATQMSPSGRHISAFVFAGDDLIMTASDPTTPFELRRLAAGGEKALTEFNAAWVAEVGIAAPEEFWIEVNGEAIQGWLLRPADNSGTGAHVPLILNVHGGPHAQFSNAFMHELQMYPARGFALVYINPRGSVGYGEDFAQQVARNWGEADTPDFLGAIDHVLTLGGLDSTRIGITGGSYGGFITNWMLGHSSRFKAAVTDRSICNLISMYGTDDIALVTFDQELGTPWDNIERYWDLSPLKYVANVTAPCLIVHSENDYRCPMEQGEQWFLALKKLGVETTFVRFPNESHGLSRNGQPKHRVERFEHTLGWFETWL